MGRPRFSAVVKTSRLTRARAPYQISHFLLVRILCFYRRVGFRERGGVRIFRGGYGVRACVTLYGIFRGSGA